MTQVILHPAHTPIRLSVSLSIRSYYQHISLMVGMVKINMYLRNWVRLHLVNYWFYSGGKFTWTSEAGGSTHYTLFAYFHPLSLLSLSLSLSLSPLYLSLSSLSLSPHHPVPPGPPTGLGVVEDSETTMSLSISWTNPVFSGFSPIDGFTVNLISRHPDNVREIPGDATTMTANLDNLSPFTAYTIRLSVGNAVGLEGEAAVTTGMTDSLRKTQLL